MSKSLPFKPSLEHLKGQAKELKKSLLEKNPEIKLQTAQNRLAHEYGFTDWTALALHIKKLKQAEKLVDRYRWTPGKQFVVLRRSNKVDVKTLEFAVNSPNPKIRAACLQLLDHLGSEDSVETFIRATFDPVASVRKHAVHGLGCEQCKEKPFQADVLSHLLRCAVSDPSEKVRYHAIYGLGSYRSNPQVVVILENILRETASPQILRAARYALGT